MALPIPMASASSSSSVSSLLGEDTEDVTLYHPVASPCSPSILRNPLASSSGSQPSPPSIASTSTHQQQRRPSVTAQMVSVVAEPPAHWAADNGWSPPRGQGRYSRSNSTSRVADADDHHHHPSTTPESESIHSRTSDDSSNAPGAAGGKLKFAPLPPGRRQYRSNSLSLGVAARAKMIQGQGAQGNVHQARYAGPQQWYQPGAPHPEDVYTYKDVQRGLGKIWQKMSSSSSRRRSSTTSETSTTSSVTSTSTNTSTSASSAEARVMESVGKRKSSEIEHIEEVHEDEDEDEDEDGQGFFEEAPRGREGYALGLEGMNGNGAAQELDQDSNSDTNTSTNTTASSSSTGDERVPPMTPEESRIGLPSPTSASALSKGKGKGVDRAERVGTA